MCRCQRAVCLWHFAVRTAEGFCQAFPPLTGEYRQWLTQAGITRSALQNGRIALDWSQWPWSRLCRDGFATKLGEQLARPPPSAPGGPRQDVIRFAAWNILTSVGSCCCLSPHDVPLLHSPAVRRNRSGTQQFWDLAKGGNGCRIRWVWVWCDAVCASLSPPTVLAHQASLPKGPVMMSQCERVLRSWQRTRLGEESGVAREETRIGIAWSQKQVSGKFLDL